MTSILGFDCERLSLRWRIEGYSLALIPSPPVPVPDQSTMPPFTRLTRLARLSRQPNPILLRRCYSSSPTSEEPLIRVTNLPAPNTGHIRVLELNRPAARNAISRALLYGLRAEVDGVHTQYDAATGDELPTAAAGEGSGPTRAVILASAVDSCFCAGADLKERRGFTPDEYVCPCPGECNIVLV